MATSGRMQGNTVDYSNYYAIDWSVSGQNIAQNYTDINWTAFWHFQSNDRQLDDGNVVINGASHWDSGGRVKNFEQNYSTRNHIVASGSARIYHNSDGTKTFNINGSLLGYSGQRSTGSANFTLPTIPRMSSPSTNKTSYNIGEAITVYTNRKSSSFTHKIRFENDGGGGVIRDIDGVGSQTTWTPTQAEINTMYSRCPNATRYLLQIAMYNNQVGEWRSLDRWQYVTDANPTFGNFTMRDSNAATVAVTGNDQKLIQGISTLEAKVASADKMVARKYATAKNYRGSFEGRSVWHNYTTGDRTFALGSSSGTGSKSVSITAYDSRDIAKTVTKNIEVIPYAPPVINATAKRDNNFDEPTKIEMSGTFSRITIGGADKNAVASGAIKYRYRQDGGSWTAYTNFTTNIGTGTFSVTPVYLSLARGSEFDIEISVTDKLRTSTQIVHVTRGIPLVMISDNKEAIGINQMPKGKGALEVKGEVYANDKILNSNYYEAINGIITDFNDPRLMEVGRYQISGNSTAAQMANRPPNIRAGYLEVRSLNNKSKLDAAWVYIIQEWIQYDTGERISRLVTTGGDPATITYGAWQHELLKSYPIKSIMQTTDSVNPGTRYGGTWTQWGGGRTPVAVYTPWAEFNTVEKIGGSKTHTLSLHEMPRHTHRIHSAQHDVNSSASQGYPNGNRHNSFRTSDRWGYHRNDHLNINEYQGGNGAHNNLQPYITCYFWKRTA